MKPETVAVCRVDLKSSNNLQVTDKLNDVKVNLTLLENMFVIDSQQ